MLGARIRRARNEANFTQEELAEKISVGVIQINRYENGKNQPTADVLMRIATALGVSADYLLGLSDDPSSNIKFDQLTAQERMVLSAMRRGEPMEAINIISTTKS